MTEVGNGVWTVGVTCGHEEFPLSYRYVVNAVNAPDAKLAEPIDRRLPLEALVREFSRPSATQQPEMVAVR